jgi:viroplasmin and RNaseH domain-containing protein
VVVGRKPRIYESWFEAAEQVVGYGGNVHRAFGTRAEAEFFLRTNRNN